MTRLKTTGLITLIAVALVSVILYVSVWIDDAKARENRSQVNDLIAVGQDLDEAQRILQAAGFRLLYSQPIKPTGDESYSQQLVIVGNTQPNLFETIGYVFSSSWMPSTHTESPYVIIEANLDGTITRID